MINIICVTSKYLVLVFMALYTIKCFTYFTAKDQKKRDWNLNVQVFYIFAIHFLCHVMLYFHTDDKTVLGYYPIQILIAILYITIFHAVYPKASRLLINNITFLMLIGYTMLTRLDHTLAVRQFILATVCLFLASFIPFIMGKLSKMRNWTVLYGIVGILVLLTVFVPGIGVSIYGARNWISIGGISLQPMEFVKIIFVLFVASGLVKASTLKDVTINALIAAAFMAVLAVEKDFGAIAIFYLAYISMVYLATSRPIFLIGGLVLVVGVVVLGYILFKDSLFYHISVRVEAWKDPFAYRDGGGYQLSESLFAIGTGGFTGLGLGKGMPYYIPVSESDFIFSAICEEMGLIFGLCLILVYVSGFIAMSNIAMKCRAPFYKYMTFGFAISYIIQVFLNIGGVTKFIPSTGVTLPLVSYGISSVFSTLIMFSMVQFVYILVGKEGEAIEEEERSLRAAAEANGRIRPGIAIAGAGGPETQAAAGAGGSETQAAAGAGGPKAWEGSGSGRPEAREGSGTGRPETWEGSGAGRPEAREGSGTGRPEAREGSGSGRPETREGSGRE